MGHGSRHLECSTISIRTNIRDAEPAPYACEAERMIICAASKAVALLQGKWRVHILCAMRDGPVRLGQLSRLLPEASKKVLMTELKQLVASGLVERRDLSNGDPVRHVEYNLIDSIRPATFLLLEQLELWALLWEFASRNRIEKQ
jgi:DNA-binding HxlR family transcriptional regulator